MLGITKAKKRFKKKVGITAIMRPLRAPRNMKRRIGYYSEPMKLIRFMRRMGNKTR